MSSPFLDIQGNPIPLERILGSGASAVVLLQNDMAIKTPLRYRWSSDYDVKANTQSLIREQDVYRRLQLPGDDRSHGVVGCIGFSTDATQLAYMVNGDLQTYIANTASALLVSYNSDGSTRWLAHSVLFMTGACLLQISPAGTFFSIPIYR